MNLFELFSLNRHGDYQEILFSSAFTYLLDPEQSHGLGTVPLEILVTATNISVAPSELKGAIVLNEENLGEGIGKIDLLIDTSTSLIGIEVKIWDRSANNISANEEKQLLRYARAINARAGSEKKWWLLFIVPHYASSICAGEYRALTGVEEFTDQSRALPLMSLCKKTSNDLFRALPGVCAKPWSECLEVLKSDSTISDGDSLARRLINDFHEFLTIHTDKRLCRNNPDPQRFPSSDDLIRLCPQYFAKLEPFLAISRRSPNPQHTVVGIPYGREEDKASSTHENCLYRLRTTTEYYSDLKDKEEKIPSDNAPLVIELWPDVVDNCSDQLHEWISKTGDVSLISEYDKHLGPKKEKVVLLNVHRILREVEIRSLEHILRGGFAKVVAISPNRTSSSKRRQKVLPSKTEPH